MKKTVVLGATTNEARTAFQAVHRLVNNGMEVVPVGIRAGVVAGLPIRHGQPVIEDVHTVTLYLNPQRQVAYYDYILEVLKPQRIIFNPGTENPELMQLANTKGIATEAACTLVMLSVGAF